MGVCAVILITTTDCNGTATGVKMIKSLNLLNLLSGITRLSSVSYEFRSASVKMMQLK